jgi:hypothetical protein
MIRQSIYYRPYRIIISTSNINKYVINGSPLVTDPVAPMTTRPFYFFS